MNLAGEVLLALPVGEAGELGVSFLSEQGEEPEVDSPDLLKEFWRESPVPIWLDWGKGAGVAREEVTSSSCCSRWAAKARVRSRWSWREGRRRREDEGGRGGRTREDEGGRGGRREEGG